MCWVDLKLSSLMHWAWDSRKQIQSYTLMLKPVFLTPFKVFFNLPNIIYSFSCFLCTHVTHFSIRLVGGDRPKSIAKWTPKIKDDQTKKASFGVIYIPVWSCQCNRSTRNWEFLKKTGSRFKQYECKLQELS